MSSNLFNILYYDSLSFLYYVVVNEYSTIPTLVKELNKLYEDPGYRKMFIEEYQKRYIDEFLR